eukprot:TRINITY_DN1234_c0_g1_i5.p1 TRINITY_DN1234_c0_g1~~TRINITY_DN1234_c0_g1_i5.p1  ORF type:complete len:105 (-),score=2.80 TRINITY_DN1234_c0_g1_i5:149-463(-)
MLSAWLRIRYPNVCSMALASSAPIKMANGYLKFVGSPPYYETVTNTLKHYGEQCPDITRRAFSEILELSSRGEEGFKLISKYGTVYFMDTNLIRNPCSTKLSVS